MGVYRPMKSFAALLLSFLIFHRVGIAAEVREAPELAKWFEAEGVSGTFVLSDPGKDGVVVYQPQRAATRYVPASTFKIPNSLIGLHVSAVRDVEEVLPYGGGKQRIAAWEKDMNLRDAIRVSNVPVYQELARRIGLERMKDSVRALGYGNQEIGTVVDRFWLDGPLKISAIEQTEFLAKLAQRKLPVAERATAAVEEITLLERNERWSLHAKTGWQPPIGWWVGWVKRGDRLATFALNMDILKEADAPKRIVVGKACLKALGVIE
jgi:beta-lactamase class D